MLITELFNTEYLFSVHATYNATETGDFLEQNNYKNWLKKIRDIY